MWNQLISFLTLIYLSSAHFILQWPPTAGFDDSLEATSPCGSFTPMVNSSSPDVQVDRFAVLIENVHPVGEWAFRATTNTKAPFDFVDVVPIIKTTGIGEFCIQNLTVLSNYAGKSGVLQVIDNSPDGILYQCAAVNFVIGSNNTAGSACTQAKGVTETWTNIKGFSGEGGSSSTTAAGSSSASASSSTSSGLGARATGVGSLIGGLALLAAGFSL